MIQRHYGKMLRRPSGVPGGYDSWTQAARKKQHSYVLIHYVPSVTHVGLELEELYEDSKSQRGDGIS